MFQNKIEYLKILYSTGTRQEKREKQTNNKTKAKDVREKIKKNKIDLKHLCQLFYINIK